MSITFGPIQSRRFKLSLGIDLSPDKKQCNFDCLYCELQGAKPIIAYDSYIDVDTIIKAVQQDLQKYPNIDVITITANGEPTLYPQLDLLVDRLNELKENKKLLILSNGSTISDPNIAKTLQKIDIVKLSLDCVTKECFKKLDRANNQINLDDIINEIISFSKIFQNDLLIEVLFVKDINTKPQHITKLHKVLQQIKPTRIDIGTIDRPPAYDVKAISIQELYDIAHQLDDLFVNVISKEQITQQYSYTKEQILAMLRRRALTKDDIKNLFDNNSKSNLDSLVANNLVGLVQRNNIEFYKSNQIIYSNKLIKVELEPFEIPWLKIIVNQKAKEFSDCSKDEKNEILRCLDIIEKYMIEYFTPTKINIASFGNYVPQVHFHIQARFQNDSYFPEPTWGKKQRKATHQIKDINRFIIDLIPRLK